jgi:hypothetical protein
LNVDCPFCFIWDSWTSDWCVSGRLFTALVLVCLLLGGGADGTAILATNTHTHLGGRESFG